MSISGFNRGISGGNQSHIALQSLASQRLNSSKAMGAGGLYEKPGGSLEIQGKSIPYVVGEQLRRVVDVAGGLLGKGVSSFRKGLSALHKLSILPTAGAQEVGLEDGLDQVCKTPNLAKRLNKIEEEIKALSGKDSKELFAKYHEQALAYKSLGMYVEAHNSYKKANLVAAGLGLDRQRFHEEARKIEDVIRGGVEIGPFREAFLEEVGFHQPTDYDCLTMCALANENIEFANTGEESLTDLGYKSAANKKRATALAAKGWKLTKVSTVKTNNYMAVAFVNKKQKTVVIAHRGASGGLEARLKEVLELAQNSPKDRCKDAKAFTDSLLAQYPEFTIKHTGHSTGAVYAELMAYQEGQTAVTSESPGVLNMLVKYHRTEGNISAPVTSYLSSPNVMNTFNGHIGTVRALKVGRPEPGSLSITASTANWVKQKLGLSDNIWINLGIDAIKLGGLIAKDLAAHDIEFILKAFTEGEGSPEYSFVQKWPKGAQERLQFNALCGWGCNPASPRASNQADQKALNAIYKTQEAGRNWIDLEEFSETAREFLLSFKEARTIPSNLDVRILNLFFMEGGRVRTRPLDKLFTVQDFHAYIQQKLFASHSPNIIPVPNPFYGCCELESIPIEGECEQVQETINRFLSLPCIQELSNIKRVEIEGFIERKEQEGLSQYLIRELAEGFEEAADEALAKMGDERDFWSLFFEVFSGNTGTEFSYLMRGNVERFKGKKLTIGKGHETIFGEVTKASFECRTLSLSLDSGYRIKVQLDGDNCTVGSVVSEKQTVRPFTGVLGELSLGSGIELTFAKGHSIPDWIKSGYYQIVDLKGVTKGKAITLKGASSSFVVEIDYGDWEVVERVWIHSIDEQEKKSFDDAFQIKKFLKAVYTTTAYVPISKGTVNEVIRISNNLGDHASFLMKIDNLKRELVQKLKEDSLYLDDLIRHMVQINFGTLTDEKVISGQKATDIGPILRRLVELIQDKGDPKEADAAYLLQEAAIEANYQRLDKLLGEDSLEKAHISEGMHLFAQSHEFTQAIAGKQMVMFVGHTGSAKSTSIASSQEECKLTRGKNSIGQSVFELKSGDSEHCPRIGKALTTSETLFAQGFPISGHPEVMVVDTPGLGDTRGKHVSLCAALSVDDVLSVSKSVRAVVLTIPYGQFDNDRGSGVIDLIREILEFYPDFLNKNQDSAHILITKASGLSDSRLEGLLEALLGDDQNPTRKVIWDRVYGMFKEGRVKIGRPEAGRRSKQQMDLYLKSSGIDPSNFNSLMNSEELKKEFANDVQKAAHMWAHDIFGGYQKHFKEIADHERLIKKSKKAVEKARDSINKIEVALDRLKFNPSSVSVKESSEYKTCIENVEKDRVVIDDQEKEINRLKQERAKIKAEITLLEKIIKDHSEGAEEEVLFETKNKPDDEIYYCSLKWFARWRAHSEGRATNVSDCVNEKYDQKVLAKDYRGTFVNSVEIDRRYQLLPQDRVKQEEFEKYDATETDFGEYRAIVSAKHAEMDYSKRVHNSGRKIVYYFKTYWEPGRDLPWMRIGHRMPKIIYHETSLKGWYTQKTEKEDELSAKDTEIGVAIGKKQAAEGRVGSQLNSCGIGLASTLEVQKEALESQIKDHEAAEINSQQAIERHKKEKVFVAAAIRTHWSVAAALRAFTDRVIQHEEKRLQTSTVGHGRGLIEKCRDYKELFDEHHLDILAKCEEDLGVRCAEVEFKEVS